MQKYKVMIEEVLSEEFTVEAQSPEDAEKIAIKKYKDSEFVLCPGNVEHRSIAVVREGEDELTWTDF